MDKQQSRRNEDESNRIELAAARQTRHAEVLTLTNIMPTLLLQNLSPMLLPLESQSHKSPSQEARRHGTVARRSCLERKSMLLHIIDKALEISDPNNAGRKKP